MSVDSDWGKEKEPTEKNLQKRARPEYQEVEGVNRWTSYTFFLSLMSHLLGYQEEDWNEIIS